MKAYVLTDVKEQEMLMDIINAMTDDQRELIAKFGGEMSCHGYVDGFNDGVNTTIKGVVAAGVGMAIGAVIYIGYKCHKAKKQKEIEAE